MERHFKTVEWALSTNIYEVNTRQYTSEGTFRAFATHLPRLRDMGVDTIWFMPVTPVGRKNRKGTLGSYYACADYRSINPEYGTMEDFRSVVREAHALGLKVIIDWVANHTGWDHVWTTVHPEFFEKDGTGSFRPPFPEWEDTIKLDYTNQELRREMIASMRFWVEELQLDGFRCDMAHLVPLDFWRQARTELDRIKPLFWLAETEDPSYHQVFDASYAWEFLHAMEKFWRGEIGMNGIDKVLHGYDDRFPPTALRAFFTSNHDENSHSGSEYERMGYAALPFAVLCATWNRSIPLVYSGQELPVKDQRLMFFDKDEIRWNGMPSLHDFYRTLLGLHRTHPALRAGDPSVRLFRLDTTDNLSVFAFLRKKEEREILVLLNLSVETVSIHVKGSFLQGNYRNVFTGEQSSITADTVFKIEPWGYRVLEK